MFTLRSGVLVVFAHIRYLDVKPQLADPHPKPNLVCLVLVNHVLCVSTPSLLAIAPIQIQSRLQSQLNPPRLWTLAHQ